MTLQLPRADCLSFTEMVSYSAKSSEWLRRWIITKSSNHSNLATINVIIHYLLTVLKQRLKILSSTQARSTLSHQAHSDYVSVLMGFLFISLCIFSSFGCLFEYHLLTWAGAVVLIISKLLMQNCWVNLTHLNE